MADGSSRRHRGWWRRAVVGVLVVAALAAVSAGVARTRLDTTVSAFVPADDPATEAWGQVQQAFGADPVVVVIETDEPDGVLDLHLPAVLSLEGRLASLDGVAVVYGPGTTLNQLAIRAQELLLEISARRDGIRLRARDAALEAGATEAEADAAADAASADFDARYGELLLGGMQAGLPTLNNPRFTRSVVYDEAGRIRPDLQWLLPDSTHAAILVRPQEILDQSALADLTGRITALVEQTDGNVDGLTATVTGAPVVTTALGDQVRRELPRLAAVAIVLVTLAFAFAHRVPWRRRFLPLLVSLAATAVTVAAFGWLGRPLSLGILGFLPILLGVGSDFPIYAARHGGTRAIVTAAVASAVGFATLALSPLPFVRSLGLALAVGVLASAALGLLVGSRLDAPEDPPPSRTSGARRPPRAVTVGVAVLAVAVAGAGWSVLPSLEVEARPDELAAGLPAVEEAEAAEEVLGASGEIAVVVDAGRDGDVLTAETLSWFRDADAAVARGMGDRLRPLLSPAQLLAFLGDEPTTQQVGAGLDVLPDYLTSAVVRADRQQALLLYGLELTDLRDQGRLVQELRSTLPSAPDGLRIDVVGLPVVAARSVALLDDARIATNLAGLLGAAAVLVIGIRRRWWAGVALVASATAFGWLLAGLWVFGLSLSPLTIALGSLTAAVGGEFTVVALERRSHGASSGFGPVEAAALTSAAGFVALVASDLRVLREFGLTLSASVALAWAASRLAVWVLPPARVAPSVHDAGSRAMPPPAVDVIGSGSASA